MNACDRMDHEDVNIWEVLWDTVDRQDTARRSRLRRLSDSSITHATINTGDDDQCGRSFNIHKGKGGILRYNTTCNNRISFDGDDLEDIKTLHIWEASLMNTMDLMHM
ncbi:unnamed protein product [Schistosoma mattheei]|uniref:Uncharacterized protein n=1 Tax=Schistosoma mattheei TaxID=31246 RepID=A0A183Q2L8_9TREM|nr:unnamed protein product [Schistosoma mattheei]